MRVLVTGSRGFIGKNLVVRLRERPDIQVSEFGRENSLHELATLAGAADAIVHLAGENRPKDPGEFERVNFGLTDSLCDAIRRCGRCVPMILASSTQAAQVNPYGRSKSAAEAAAEKLAADTGSPVATYRLPGVFGKWCRPNYNSVVATFCHNIANGLSIRIDDPATVVRLVYIDDVIADFMAVLQEKQGGMRRREVAPEYSIALGDLAEQIRAFGNCRTSLVSEPVGTGLVRALYATYVSYLPPGRLTYDLPRHGDERGVFVEMLKTPDAGQFSYFTAHPGVTRGGHYHHTKTEKFLVIKGKARFGFRHILTNETHELFTSGDAPRVVETVPGWSHDITNIGEDEMIVMLWANEIFDRAKPDTYDYPV